MGIYMKAFLMVGIQFGLLMSISNYLPFGMTMETIYRIFMVLFLGLFICLALSFIQVRRLANRLNRFLGPSNFLVERKIRLPCCYERAFDLCQESLEVIDGLGYEIQDKDRERGEIIAKTGLPFKDWGELITFRLRRGRGLTKIEVTSRSISENTITDFGKNLENVERIIDYLQKNDS